MRHGSVGASREVPECSGWCHRLARHGLHDADMRAGLFRPVNIPVPFLTSHFLTVPLRRFCSGPIKGIPQAPGGEGCYRCPNGGYCTAPDTCTCTEGWTGYDCRTPVQPSVQVQVSGAVQ